MLNNKSRDEKKHLAENTFHLAMQEIAKGNVSPAEENEQSEEELMQDLEDVLTNRNIELVFGQNYPLIAKTAIDHSKYAICVAPLFPLMKLFNVLHMNRVAVSVVSGASLAGYIHLTATYYGILNNMLATRDSLEYFRFGQNPGQLEHMCIPATNPDVQAFHWGILSTSDLSKTTAALLGVTITCASLLHGASIDSSLAPAITFGSVITLGFAHIAAKNIHRLRVNHNIEMNVIPEHNQDAILKWHACNLRNLTGYVMLPVLGALALGFAIVPQNYSQDNMRFSYKDVFSLTQAAVATRFFHTMKNIYSNEYRKVDDAAKLPNKWKDSLSDKPVMMVPQFKLLSSNNAKPEQVNTCTAKSRAFKI